MKKYIVASICSALCILAAGCGAETSDVSHGKAPEITISEVRETKKVQSSPVKKNASNAQNTSFIGNEITDMIGSEIEEIMLEISGEDIGAVVEDTEDGSSVTTDTDAQREAVVNAIDGHIRKYVDDLRKKKESVRFSYDVRNGYIDIYCMADDALDVGRAIDSIAGLMAFGQRIYDNTAEWGITVIVSDSETSRVVSRGSISSEDSFMLLPDDWDDAGMENVPVSELESEIETYPETEADMETVSDTGAEQ